MNTFTLLIAWSLSFIPAWGSMAHPAATADLAVSGPNLSPAACQLQAADFLIGSADQQSLGSSCWDEEEEAADDDQLLGWIGRSHAPVSCGQEALAAHARRHSVHVLLDSHLIPLRC